MKITTILVLVPLALVATILAVANREPIAFRLDPFANPETASVLMMPLFLLVFLSFLLGVLVGGLTVALRRTRNAQRERLAAVDVANALALDAQRSPEPPR